MKPKKPVIALFGHTVVACLGMLAASVAINLFPEFNVHDPDLIWFPIPTIFVALCVLLGIEYKVRLDAQSPPSLNRGMWFSNAVFIVVALIVDLTLTGWGHVFNGTADVMEQARYPAGLFRTIYPFVMGASAGFVEEATVRGLLQLKVSSKVGSAWSQIVAGVLFVGMHGPQLLKWNEFLFLVLLASMSGILAAKSRSVLPSAVFHSAVNFSVAAVVSAFR